MEEDEEYDFEYSDDDEEEPDVEVENAYYNAKSVKNEENDKDRAIDAFQKVVDLEVERGERGEWGFKAMKQIVKLLFLLGRTEEMLRRYVELLDNFAVGSSGTSAVTQNVAEKGIDGILDHVSSSSNLPLLHSLYEITLQRLSPTTTSTARKSSERLWFKVNLKLGHLLLQEIARNAHTTEAVGRLQRLLKELMRCCESNPGDLEGADVIKRGTQLLEVYALQIQFFSLRRDLRRLKELYQQSLRITWAVPHPRTLGIIQECGGKMYMQEKEYDRAIQAFFQSFKCYDEVGEGRRLLVLKYLVLASLLSPSSSVDPLESQEARPYRDHGQVLLMRQLLRAFQERNVQEFERLLKTHRSSLLEDDFIRAHIDDLLRTVRTQVLINLLIPYRRVSLTYLAQELNNISEEEVEGLLVSLILDGKVQASIDQIEGVVLNLSSRHGGQYGRKEGGEVKEEERGGKEGALIRWCDVLSSEMQPSGAAASRKRKSLIGTMLLPTL